MINKYIVLGLLSSITVLSYSSSANANYYNKQMGDVTGGKVNSQAWRGYTQAKQRKYDMEHTLERAPFPSTISGGNVIKVDLGKLAWGAYDSNGKLIKWG